MLIEYVAEIYECLTTSTRAQLDDVSEELINMTPEPRRNMLECQDKEEAIAKYNMRKAKETVIVKPTCTG